MLIGLLTSCRRSSRRAGSIPVGAIVKTGTAWGGPAAGEPTVLFLLAKPRVSLLVLLMVSTAIGNENHFKFNWLWY